jgi:predicted O-methyltransferase YrrM
VTGAHQLELVVRTSRWEYCHALWLEPQLDGAALDGAPRLSDSLGRTLITPPHPAPHAERCIATVASAGFASHLDDLLGSICANAHCPDALLVVFAVDPDVQCLSVAEKYGATLVQCTRQVPVNATVKSVLYSAAHVIDAERFICFDADMLVLGDLRPVFGALDVSPPGSILAVREANGQWYTTLEQALTTVYGGRASDVALLAGRGAAYGAYQLVVNDGTFAGSRAALQALDGVIRSWPHATSWVDERRDIWWRNQFVFNLALAHLGCGVELDGTCNVQLNSTDVVMERLPHRVRAMWRGQEARVLHFNGLGRAKHPEFRGAFASVEEPVGHRGDRGANGDGDGYAAFLESLRGWVGLHGRRALAWSLYGTADATTARVLDPVTFPLFALLHYLVRANGCVRIVETGTGRGVSTACLACAVARHDGARIVTFDPVVHAEREALWAALPPRMRSVIEPHAQDSLAGLADALRAGEAYDAALLDSLHTGEHVWSEFQLAAQLVCPGGLILIHDARLSGATVAEALTRIESAGYGVTRLWTAECGLPADDQLGLAVIENRRRTVSAPG